MNRQLVACVLVLVFAGAVAAQPQTTAFSYQGRLTVAGAPPTGAYDFQFGLFPAVSGGSAIGPVVSINGAPVSGGLFTAMLDFGQQFDTGARRWLEIAVRPAGVGAFTTLTPRQPITAAPQASGLVLPMGLEHGVVGSPVLAVINTASGPAISATGSSFGISGTSDSSAGTGVYGIADLSAGAVGVRGASFNGTGVLGEHQLSSGTQPGVEGSTISQSPNAIGVWGRIATTLAGGGSAALRGTNQGTGSGGTGVWGSHNGTGWGVYGSSPVAGIGVVGQTGGSGGIAVWGIGTVAGSQAGKFSGAVQVTGALSKGGGSFKIDHPLDPANKYLYHSFVESPDMMNIYNGNAVTDGRGYAVIILPEWFETLNRDFRYQLTVIDEADTSDFVQAKVVSGVKGNRFSIRTSAPHARVSWQVTGIRRDAWAEANRIPVEEPKPARERGYYLHPELYGQPETASLDALVPRGVSPEDVRADQERDQTAPRLPRDGHAGAGVR